MTDPHAYRPAPGSIPESPGVYRFRDGRGRVIYVGKAKNLRARLNSYFADFAGLHPRTQSMLTSAAGVDWTVVSTEVEALQLEYSWIKEFDPRFNVRYRDDKSYPYLAVTMDEEYPRVMVMRGARRRGTRYFGPYSHAWAIRETVDTLLRVFPVRTCSAGVFKRARQIGRPCLLGYIGKCSAPCVGRIDADEHPQLAEEFCDFMAGQTGKFTRRLEAQMREAAQAEEFERAARLRDDLQALQRALEKQAVVLPDGTDCDVIGLIEDQLEAAVQVFYVRDGRVRGQRGWVVDKVEDLTTGELVEQFLGQVYRDDPGAQQESADQLELAGPAPKAGRASADWRAVARRQAVPREVLVPVLPPDTEAIQDWLTTLRGGRVTLRVPQRGDKRTLLETVTRNATESLALHKTRRASDLSTRSQAMQEIQDALGLDMPPLRIECFDVSNLQGTNVVASMVVFEDGLARKSEYRKFAYPPSLLVIDGGPGQVDAAVRALSDLGITDIAVCGLAKRLEEVWLPAEDSPVIMPRSSEGLYLLQRVRDEAHRSAITYHRAKRAAAQKASELDALPGLGPARKAALLKSFGSVKRLREATAEQIAEVDGFGPRLAEKVAQALHGTGGS